MYSVAIVDDEKAFSDQLAGMLRRWQDAHGVELNITCFQDGIDIAEDFKSKWDIIFLDIQMKLLDGLETARRIRACDSDVILIFVTTMGQYAINGYEVDAFDYILKPLEYSRFELRMNKAVKEAEKRKAHAYVYLKRYSDMVKVSTDDILFIEVNGHTLIYTTADGIFERRAKISDAEAELIGLPFSRCSLSYLVNLKRVDRVSKDSVFIAGKELPISRTRKKEFLQAFTDYLEAGF